MTTARLQKVREVVEAYQHFGNALPQKAMEAIVNILAAPEGEAPVAAKAGALIALAEKCSAEVGRYEGEVVWVKFHSQAAVEAFATGIVMSAALKAATPPAVVGPSMETLESWTERLVPQVKNDAFETAAQVARQYGHRVAAAIRALKTTPGG